MLENLQCCRFESADFDSLTRNAAETVLRRALFTMLPGPTVPSCSNSLRPFGLRVGIAPAVLKHFLRRW